MWGRKGWPCLALWGVCLGSVNGVGLEAAERKPRLLLPFDAAAVRQTVDGAKARLRTPACQGLLDEFQTTDGVSLKQRLEETGATLETRLGELRFFDASDLPACRSAQVYAFTRPGLGAVYVCTTRFTAARLEKPEHVEAVVIHELLHTVGLGENPPTPAYITARVKDRCHSRETATAR
jgi:hypothetical protein